MNILVLGGTRFIGTHMVKSFLKAGHNVTIATRGYTKDEFGSNVKRILLERTNPDSISKMLSKEYYDIICDNLAYCSNEVKYLLDTAHFKRYIMTSTMSVYTELHPNIVESDFDPLTYPLKWCSRDDYPYDEIKRQAECALFQVYSQVSAAAVRFPFVIGEDDYTNRLYFYVEHVVKGIPMYVDNLNEKMGFIRSCEAGSFLAWLAEQDYIGPINGGNSGNISLQTIINYVEKQAKTKAIFALEADAAPYNSAPEYSIITKKAEDLGFQFSTLESWIYVLLDKYIERAQA